MRFVETNQFVDAGDRLSVEWHDCRWQLPIQTRAAAVAPRDLAIKPLISAVFMPHPARRKNLFKLMKKTSTAPRRYRTGFTLIELLVVIAIIGILAAMLMPALIGVKKSALKVKAKTEMADLVNAINAYDTEYGRFPITSGGNSGGSPVLSNEQLAAGTNDFTTGVVFGPGNFASGAHTYDNNSNVVSILMDLQTFPNGKPTMYPLHEKNPKQIKFLNAKMSGYDPINNPDPNPLGGVDNTGVYRDPWGNPYIITMDNSYDEQCSDFIYCQKSVSQTPAGTQQGFNGLVNTIDPNGAGDHFYYHGKVMVWSAGPDKKYNSGQLANIGDNKDNILSWQ